MPVCLPRPRAATRFVRFAPVPFVLIAAATLLASVLCSGSALAQTAPDAGPPFVNPYDDGASPGPSYATDGHDPAANDRKAGVSELNGDRILLNDPGAFPSPVDVDSGDIDGDGDADLVLSLAGSGQLVWLENRCGPSSSSSQNCFGPPTVIFPRRNAIPHLIDVDGDADLDIVSVLPYDDEIVWFENTNASFSESRVIADLPGAPILMAPGDFDGDGLADVAVVRGQDSAVDFYTDLTTTPQLVQTVTTGGRVFTPSMLEVANLDADAADELVVGTTAPSPSPVNVYNADGSFTISRSTASMSTDYVHLIAVGDVDGDGDPDVVGASQNPDAGTYPLPWFPTEGGLLTGAAQTYRNVDDYPDRIAFLPAPAGSAQPLVMASRVNNQDTEIRLFESSPTGGSLASVTLLDGMLTNDLRAVPVDATAGADLVTVDRDGHQVYWHRNERSTTGGFTLVEALAPAPDLVEPESPVALDVDEDGDQDIVALGYTDNQIAWYEQTNDAPLAFAPAQYIVDGTTTGPIAAVAAEVTGDARPDLIVATNRSGMVYLYENDPGVGFTRTLLTSGLTDIEDLRFTDLDGDAFEDLVILSEDGGRLDWIPRSGGTFDIRQKIDDVAGSSVKVNLPVLEGSMAVADFDGNGVPSIVTVNNFADLIEFREGTGGGAFAAPVTLYDADTGSLGLPLEAGVMDVNDDGRPDLVVAFRAGRASEIVWRENQGGSPATFGPAQLIANENAVAYPSAIQAHDMDLDGTEDLVLAPTYAYRGVVVILRTGPGQFSDPVSVNSRIQGARGLLVTPLNAGDAHPEIVATSVVSNEVSVFLNKNTITTQAFSSTVNVTGDGLVSFEDPGVRINFQGVTGSGDVTVRYYSDGPAVPVDISEQRVSLYRYTIDAEPTLSFAPTTSVRFRPDLRDGVQVPEDVVIYARDIPGIGTFRPLDTQVEPRNETYELVVQVGSFSEFAYASDNLDNQLPVELSNLSADADGDEVVLSWQTLSETGNRGFYVERRLPETRSATWTDLGFVEGRGTRTQASSYAFTDATLPFGTEHAEYRLRQVDVDGAVTRSAPVRYRAASPEQLTLRKTAPNPARTRARLRYELPTSGDVRIELYNVLGQRVRQIVSGTKTAGRHQAELDVTGLASGVYFVRMIHGGSSTTQRLSVVR